MKNKLIKVTGDLSTLNEKERREKILDFESLLSQQKGAYFGDSPLCPLIHRFADGIYVREIFIPKGTHAVGKIHKCSHPVFLMSGTIELVTEAGGCEVLTGPLSIISAPGTKRAARAVTDVVWITVHSNPTNTQDLKELESIVIADSYEAYDKFLERRENRVVKFLDKIIRGVQLKLTGS